MEAIRTDRAHLNASLIETTGKIRDSETRIEAAQKRLDGLRGSEQAIRVSLDNRRAIIGEVLASLQRMGRRSPPALLVRPEDVLSAIRTSMLLGAVLPEMRAETEALTADLGELVKLRTAISSERDTLSREIAGMNRAKFPPRPLAPREVSRVLIKYCDGIKRIMYFPRLRTVRTASAKLNVPEATCGRP